MVKRSKMPRGGPGGGGGNRSAYDDIPDGDDDDFDGGGGGGGGGGLPNPFASSSSSSSPPAMRAGGADATTDLEGLEEYEYGHDYDSPRGGGGNRRKRGTNGGQRRMDIATVGTVHGDMQAGMAKMWIYMILALLALTAVLLGIMFEGNSKHNKAVAVGGPGAGAWGSGHEPATVDDEDDDDEIVDDDDYEGIVNPNKPRPTASPTQQDGAKEAPPGGEEAAGGVDEDEGTANPPTKAKPIPGAKVVHHYDARAAVQPHDPFHVMTDASWYGTVFNPPPFPAYGDVHTHDSGDDGDGDNGSFASDDNLGYLQDPDVHNSTLVFCSEGDLYLTTVPPDFAAAAAAATSSANDNAKDGDNTSSILREPLPAVKLTTTVGNVLSPKINPVYPYLVAFTATYTGTREAYLLDLRPNHRSSPSVRLTYFDGPYGVSKVVGWDDDGQSLVVSTMSDEIGMEDVRLYKIGILQQQRKEQGQPGRHLAASQQQQRLSTSQRSNAPVTVSTITPVPLSQAIDSSTDVTNGCLYFTRFKQSSQTYRYVGGTAEHLWVWCDGKETAVPLSGDYRGTSRVPRLYTVNQEGGDGKKKNKTTRYLLFLSDRHDSTLDGDDDNGPDEGIHTNEYGWTPSTLNLWAMPLPTLGDLYDNDNDKSKPKLGRPFQLTTVSCDFGGMSLMEYGVDDATGNVVLRIGADLHFMGRDVVVDLLSVGGVFGNEDAGGDGGDRRRVKGKQNKNEKKKTKPQEEKQDVADDAEPTEEVDVEADEGKGVDDADEDGTEGKKAAAQMPVVAKKGNADNKNGGSAGKGTYDPSSLTRLPIAVYSDFQSLHERLVPPSIPQHVSTLDIFSTPYGTLSTLMTVRGQVFVNPVVPDVETYYDYQGGGMNVPPRRYKVAPGSTTGGMIRIHAGVMVPQKPRQSNDNAGEEGGADTGGVWDEYSRMALILATDPTSPTSELAFYLLETTPGLDYGRGSAVPSFVDVKDLPVPIIGGNNGGGSVKEGGLGSVNADSVTVSPCGRRLAWTDTDGRIVVMTLPDLVDFRLASSGARADEAGGARRRQEAEEISSPGYTVLPQQNENGEPLVGIGADLSWSPGGRYLAIEHSARNQFSVISIADLGSPDEENYNDDSDKEDSSGSIGDGGEGNDGRGSKITVGRIVQATPDRFNSQGPVWGRTSLDIKLESVTKSPGESGGSSKELPAATTLYFLSDRDVVLSGVTSPWGTRAPSPHFEKKMHVHALQLVVDDDDGEGEGDGDDVLAELKQLFAAPFAGGGASELMMLREVALSGDDDENEGDAEGEDDGKEGSGGGRERHEMRALKKKATKVDNDKDATFSPTAMPTIGKAAAKATAATAGAEKNAIDTDASQAPSSAPTPPPEPISPYTTDATISFGPESDPDLSFARRSYRLSNIPAAKYVSIVSQLNDDPSLILLENADSGPVVKVFSVGDYPTDSVTAMPIELKVPMEVIAAGVSTSRRHLYFIYKSATKTRTKIVPNDADGVISKLIKDEMFSKNIVDTVEWALSIWPTLEYQQLYSDAWRMLRDYFYDKEMTDIDWPEVHARYLPLVRRCAKREELDDVLRQMASELSALHVFVYGGEYSQPLHGDGMLEFLNEVGSLGATLRRSVEWAGYVVTAIPESDPDFNLMDGKPVYSPLSDRVLQMSGQRGLEVGDVVVGVNGESVMNVPGLHMLLRGMAGRTVRLDVLRVKSGPSPLLSRRRRTAAAEIPTDGKQDEDGITPEPLIVVPLSPEDASNLRYSAWEWKTRQSAKSLAAKAGFTTGYIHLRDMSGAKAEDAFVRGFFPDYDKDALIVDVRHNHGGNIDSWLLDVLQRRAWMYWQGRATNITNGGLGWDEQFAFRGHLVVLIDEKTSSDGEGFSRGVSELGLGKLVGTRTWGGGIWLSSDNKLVDGGIASAPEIGTYNKNFGWGLGIENLGVEPDIEIDNDPRETYDGKDSQLEKAIEVMKDWLEEEPIVLPKSPGRHRDMSLHDGAKGCPVR